ncbi:hypothetical protein JTB14_010818 [Gonioctena quinquepunctata]|nr:hypothetical protein JTB14_010818 [Gonioctena quinquepunctata]
MQKKLRKKYQTARAKRKIVDDGKNDEKEKTKKRKNTTTLENIFDDRESEDDFEADEESEFSIGSENFSHDEFLSPNSLKCGDFVVVLIDITPASCGYAITLQLYGLENNVLL